MPQITNGAEADAFLATQINTSTSTKSFVDSTSSPAVAILTTEAVQYVRFYNPGGQQGAFLAPSYAVRGLTAEEVKDVLALPFLPTMQTIVQVPAGSCLIIGKGGPILNSLVPPLGVWGNGGAVQVYLVGKNVGGGCGTGIPGFTGTFLNGQAIGAAAFLYGPHVGGGNGGAVAAALDRGPYPAQFTAMDSLYNSLDLLNFGNTAPLNDALLQLDGEIHAGITGALLDVSRFIRQAVNGRLQQRMGGPGAIFAPRLAVLPLSGDDGASSLAFDGEALAYADGKRKRAPDPIGKALASRAPLAPAGPWATAWGQTFGNWGRARSDGNAASLDRTDGGFVTGLDKTFAPNLAGLWRFGGAVGYQRTSVSVSDRSSSGGVDTYHLAAYVGTQRGPLAVRGGVAHSWHDISTSRAIAFPGFSDATRASYNARTTQVFGEVGYGFVLRQAAFEPFLSLAHVDVRTGAMSEAGGAAALTAGSRSDDTTFSTLGLRAAAPVSAILSWHDATGLVAKATVGWRRAFGTVTPGAQLVFASGGSAFTVLGTPIARDAAAVELGIDGEFARNATLGVAYTGQLSHAVVDHGVNANVQWRF